MTTSLLSAKKYKAGGVEVHRRTGVLAVNSPQSVTIAVDLRDSDILGFVVGRIAANTRLRRGEREVGLHDFQEGETVSVTWRKSSQGTEILTLQARESSRPPQPVENSTTAQQPLPENRDFGLSIGKKHRHRVKKGDTLLDIARRYDLGFNELTDLYPQYDPWLPPLEKVLVIPSQWLLPDSEHKGLVINIPEMRLFAYSSKDGKLAVRTFPIGIGDLDYPTPVGSYRIGTKRVHPAWYVPPSLREKYQQAIFPPGLDNPLGDYWIGLEGTLYGIHGTDIPWSVGRLVTHGCIRMYPEDIEEFYPSVSKGLQTKLVYQPVKIAVLSGRLSIEVHKDVYSLVGNLAVHGRNLIGQKGFEHLLDPKKFERAVKLQNGVPTDVTSRLQD